MLMQSRIFRMSLVIAGILFAIGTLNGGSLVDRVLVGLVLGVPAAIIGAGVTWALSPSPKKGP